jgi:hypothetical protein
MLAADTKLAECAAAAHKRQTEAWPNFTSALKEFQSSAFVKECAAIKKLAERAAGKFTKAENRLKKAQECVLSYSLEPKENRLRKIEFGNSSTDGKFVARKEAPIMFKSPEEFLEKNHSPRSQVWW